MSSNVFAFLNCSEVPPPQDPSRAEEAALNARENALAEALSDRSHELALSLHLAPRS